MKNYCIIHILLFVLLMLVYQCSHAQSFQKGRLVVPETPAGSCDDADLIAIDHKIICPDLRVDSRAKVPPANGTVVREISAWENFSNDVGKYSEVISNRVRETWRKAVAQFDFTDELNAWLKTCAEQIISLFHR